MKQNKSQKPDNSLPEKLWELIQVALMDLALAEMMPEYEVDMGAYHEPNSKCRVCFAGSVIAAINNYRSYKKEIRPEMLADEYKYYALNQARQYCFISALNMLGIYEPPNNLRNKINQAINETCSYEVNPELFKANMETAAGILKKYDL